jgi:DNA recombination protein RmuC
MDPVLLIISLIALLLGLAVVWLALQGGRQNNDDVARLIQTQAELSGRLGQLTEAQSTSWSQFAKVLEDRMIAVSTPVTALSERIAVIDAAQRNIAELSANVVSLKDILSNKQARGAHGQTQMEDLVKDALPPSVYRFQAKLSNGKMADCLLTLPNPPGAIAVDAKYPLESYLAFRQAPDEAARIQAARNFSADVIKHVKDIAERYIVPGETADSALMFLPSEAVYAELHASFPNVIEESYRRKVWIVSPTTLMATLNTVRAVLKDASIKEQAVLIQAELRRLVDDVKRMDERANNLQKHFGQANEDLRQLLVSSEKITKRIESIGEIEVGEKPE